MATRKQKAYISMLAAILFVVFTSPPAQSIADKMITHVYARMIVPAVVFGLVIWLSMRPWAD